MNKIKKILVRISRAKWSRGHSENALLLKHSKVELSGNKTARRGNMCCLGFACLAVGAKRKDILDVGLPACTEKLLPGLTEKSPYRTGFIDDTDFSQSAAEINDDSTITDKQRQKKLRNLADENGFKFVFVP